MASALGVLKWPPDVFWKATFYEFTAAMKGHLLSSGADLTQPPTRDEVNQAFEAHEQRVKAAMVGN